MLGHGLNPNNHPWWWLLRLDPCPNILEDFWYLSMSKHPWWWLLQFDSCPSILDDVRWDSIDLKASLTHSMPWTYINVQKSWFSYHGRIYPHECIFLFYLVVREFLLWSLKGVLFSFLFLQYDHSRTAPGKRKNAFVRMHIYVHGSWGSYFRIW